MKPQDKLLTVVGVTVVLAIASGAGYTLFTAKDSESARATSPTDTVFANSTAATPQQTSSAASDTATYKDGTYTTTASYRVPEGETNSVSVTLTVSGGSVTAVSTTHDYGSRESKRYVDWFDQEINSTVVGKSLNGLQVSRVGGASLTSIAFDDALDTIRSDAKA